VILLTAFTVEKQRERAAVIICSMIAELFGSLAWPNPSVAYPITMQYNTRAWRRLR